MNGLCLTSSILYQATITCSDGKYKQKRYKGICETTFKKRYANHKRSFNLIKSKNDTTLSIEYWNLKVQSCKLKKHRYMIAYVFQKYPGNFVFQLFLILQ